MRTHPRAAALFAAALCVLIASGCEKKEQIAEGRAKPKGRILENGQPIKIVNDKMPPGDPGFKVTFVRIDGAEAGQATDAVIFEAREGLFELNGVDGKGIEPGRYRVAISVGPMGGQDKFKGKYSPDKSKIEVEVKAGEDLVIDLANYK